MSIQTLTVCFLVLQGSVATHTHLRHRDEVVQPAVSGVTDVSGLSKPKLMGMIDAFRAEVCGDLKDEHGRKFESFGACKKFMEKVCKPGKDKQMDGDSKEVTTGKGHCAEYFAEQKAEKALAAPAPAPASAAPAPAKAAPAPSKAAPAPAKAAPAPAKAAPAPAQAAPAKAAPAPANAAAASAPAPATAKKAEVKDDKAWYTKEDGKWSGRMHMDANLKLPSQGFWGKLIEHDDGKTATGDWGKEFGSGAGDRNYFQICKDHPENRWCHDQGFTKHKHSAGYKATFSVVAMMTALAVGLV